MNYKPMKSSLDTNDRGGLSQLDPTGIMIVPTEAGREGQEGTHVEVVLEEDIPRVLEVEYGGEVQPEARGVNEVHPSSPIIMMVAAL